MEMLARFARDGQPFMMGKQPNPIHWFAAADLGRLVAIAYQKEEAANKRFFIHGPQAMTMRQALEHYCAVFHPDGKPVSVMPIWLAKVMGTLTGNKTLKFAAGLMDYFDKIGEMGDPAETNEILGGPTTTLDAWIKQRQIETAQEGQTA
jgi:NADH dehydrogenase